MNWPSLTNLLRNAAGTVAPAIVCRVEKSGRLLYEEAYGWLDPEQQQNPTRVDSLFDYASLTKLFTSTAALRLIDIGALDLETPLVEIIPEFGENKLLGGAEDPITKQPIPVDPRWLEGSGSVQGPIWFETKPITIRSLLTHTSGLPAWRSVYRACGPAPSSNSIMRQAEQAQRWRGSIGPLAAYPVVYPPGKSYVYSDVGLLLLGIAITRVSGESSLEMALHTLVQKPLSLSTTFLPSESLNHNMAPTEHCSWRGRRLLGEVHDENAAGIGGIAGHAGLFGNAHDLCRLGRLYLENGTVSHEEQFLSPELIREAIAEQVCTEGGVRRGLGWMLRSEPNPSCSRLFSMQSFGHTGYTGTSLWCDPTQDLTVALLTNRVYYGRDPQKIAQFRPMVHEAVCQIINRQ